MGKHKDAEDGAAVRERWWRTYNAAVGGMVAGPLASRLRQREIHDRAASLADIAHGPVVETFTPPLKDEAEAK